MLSHYSEADEPGERLTFRLSFGDWCCVVGDCIQPVTVEVYDEDYKTTLKAMGFRCDQKQTNRRSGSPRIFACDDHAKDRTVNAALHNPRWQGLLMPV